MREKKAYNALSVVILSGRNLEALNDSESHMEILEPMKLNLYFYLTKTLEYP